MEDLSRYYALLKDPTRRRIIEVLGNQEKIGFKELRETLGVGVGTVYYHLDMLSDFIEQDKQRKYRLNAKGQMLYRVLKDGSVPASLEISETLSHRAVKWLFLSPIFALTAKPYKFLPISAAVLVLGAFGASIARLEPALLFYFEYSTRSPTSIAVLFIFNWIGLFLFTEVLAIAIFKRIGNDLQLFTCVGLAAIPLAVYPYIYLSAPAVLEALAMYSWQFAKIVRDVVLVILQVWSILLVSAAVCHGKGLRLDKGIIISLTATYLNIAVLFILGKFT
ncbi:helix-turn-helix transcriptional regulator [Candidatus Bathyarchaeota archaeon]|nr:helix-turn-helix transcriptional regulator [Candidatus Bathyarchaeota archaeon]